MFITTNRGRILALEPATGADRVELHTPRLRRQSGCRRRGRIAVCRTRRLVGHRNQSEDRQAGMDHSARSGPASQGMTAQPVYGGGVVVATVSGGDNFARGRAIGTSENGEATLGVRRRARAGSSRARDVAEGERYLEVPAAGPSGRFPRLTPTSAWSTSQPGMRCHSSAARSRPGDNLYTNSVVALELKTARSLALSARPPRHLGTRCEHGARPL